jgi:8-oxo-dGTP pyrophosphatase MutT (NUDIX family)
VLGIQARAASLLAGATGLRRQAARLQPARSASRRLLRRWLPIALALTPRLARLRRGLNDHPAESDDDPSLIWAAVAVVLTPDPDSLLLIRRAERTGDPWSGHIALPGGRREPADADLVATAIREAQEELRIQLMLEDLAGSLEDVVPRTPVLPPIAVRPHVFILPARPALIPNDEVASAHWVTIDYLLRPGTHHPVRLEISGQSRQVQAYQLEDGIVWGMTERILTGLVSRF